MPSSASSTTDIYTLSLHDALPIFAARSNDASVEACAGFQLEARALHGRAQCGGRDPEVSAGKNLAERDDGRAVRRLVRAARGRESRSEEHMSELQSQSNLVCRLLLRRPPTSTLFPYTTLFRSLLLEVTTLQSKLARAFNWKPERFTAVRNAVDEIQKYLLVKTWLSAMMGVLCGAWCALLGVENPDRKSTCLNSSHSQISYAVFCFVDHRHLHSFPTRRSSDLCCSK